MPHRIRILFVIGTMSGGGAERQIIQILRLIDRTQFQPMLYLSTRAGELLSQVPLDVPVFSFRSTSADPFWLKVARRFKLSPILRYLHLACVLKREQIDLVYDRTYLATLDAAGATWLRPTPRISCCVVDPQPELELHSGKRRSLMWRIARSAYRRADRVLANSEGLRQRVIEYFQLPASRVLTRRNLIDLEELDRKASKSPPDVPLNSFLIIAVGRLHPQKGYQFLLEAMADLVHRRNRSVHLIILGTGDSITELSRLAQNRRIQEFVTFAGFVDNPLPWMRKARLFVLPSLYEGLPNALLEAVACGTPVLATDCPSGPREILDAGRLGELVPCADSMALADGIQAAMDHYPEWRRRAMIAQESVRERYDARRGIRDLEELFRHVLR